jgi:hypothetical protein
MVRLLPLPLLSHEETLEQQALLELPEPQVLKAHRVSKANPELLEPQAQLAQQAHKGQRAIKAIQGTLALQVLRVLPELQGHRGLKVIQAHKGQQGLRELLGRRVRLALLEPLAPELQRVEPLVNSLQRILQPIMTLHGQTPLTEALTNHG